MASIDHAAGPAPNAGPLSPAGELTPRWISTAAWIAVAVGVAMQLLHYSGGKPLWLDEAMVGLNIRHLSVAELIGPLDYDQVAPIGWLLLEKLFHGLPIPAEYSLRLPALIAGVAGLLLFRTLAFRALSGLAALAAVILYALSPVVLRYASEVKPYGFDAFVSVVLMLIAFDLLQRDRSPWLRLAGLWLAGLIAVTLSFPAVYILASVGLLLFAKRVLERRWGEAATLTLIGLTWLAAFAGLYLMIFQPQAANSTVTSGGGAAFFENTSFAPIPLSLGDLAWYAAWSNRSIEFFFGQNARFAIVIAAAAGLLALVRRPSWLGGLLILPPVLAIVGSTFHTYPIFDRLLMFLGPGLWLLLGLGAGVVATKARPAVVPWAILLFICVSGGIPYIQGNLRAHPQFAINNFFPLLDTLKKERRPGDVVYLSNEAIPAWLFYKGRYGLSDMPWIAGKTEAMEWPCFVQDFAPEVKRGRVWVVILTVAERDPPTVYGLPPSLANYNLKAKHRMAAEGWNMWLYQLDVEPLDPTVSLANLPAPPRVNCSPELNPNLFDPSPRASVRAN